MFAVKAKLALVMLTLILLVTAAFAAAAGGQPAPKEQSARVDLYGDPLPEGAIARLGTVRFRQNIRTGAAAFSPDGKLLASSGGNGFGLCLWDVATGRLVREIKDVRLTFSQVFSPDGKLLIAVTSIDGVAVIDVATGNLVRRGPGAAEQMAVALAPDGHTVASAEEGNGSWSIILWDLHTGQEIRRLEGHTGFINGLSFSRDGKLLASGSDDKTMRLWNTATGAQILQVPDFTDGVWHVAFSPDGKTVAAAGWVGGHTVWDSATGKLVHMLTPANLGSGGQVCFSPDGATLASSAYGKIHLWDAKTGKEVRSWQANAWYVVSLAFSPDGKALVTTGNWDHAIRLWDPATGKEINPTSGHTGLVQSIRFGAEGKTLTSVGIDRKLKDWDLATATGHDRPAPDAFKPPISEWMLTLQQLSPDGRILARVGAVRAPAKDDFRIQLIDATTGKELHVLRGHMDRPFRLVFSPDGKTLASLANDGIQFWNVAEGKHIRWLLATAESGFAFSPDGAKLAFQGLDKIPRVWDVASWKEQCRWDNAGHLWFEFAFSPDGKALTCVAGGYPSTITLRAADTGKEQLRLQVQTRAHSLDWSPTGRIFAAAVDARNMNIGTEKTTVHLWDTLSGQEIKQFNLMRGVTWAMAFAPDGRTLATGGSDSTILLWDLTGQAGRGKPESPTSSPAELKALWADLAHEASTSERALWALAFSPRKSLPFIKEAMKPMPEADAKLVHSLVADLGNERFALRQKAAQALEELGESAEKAVRTAMKSDLVLETRQRLEQFLAKRDADLYRKLRAVEAVEQMQTAEARQVLDALAKDSSNPRVAQAAGAALARLGKHSK